MRGGYMAAPARSLARSKFTISPLGPDAAALVISLFGKSGRAIRHMADVRVSSPDLAVAITLFRIDLALIYQNVFTKEEIGALSCNLYNIKMSLLSDQLTVE